MSEKPPERIYHYLMDEEGHLYHDGGLLDEPKLYHFFLKHLEVNQDKDAGRFPYFVACAGERNLLACRDVPYVVWRLEKTRGVSGAVEAVSLFFQGDYSELLDPATLEVGKDNVLYCRVRAGTFRARFSRKAYYDLAGLIVEKAGDYYLRLAKGDYLVHHSGHEPGSASH